MSSPSNRPRLTSGTVAAWLVALSFEALAIMLAILSWPLLVTDARQSFVLVLWIVLPIACLVLWHWVNSKRIGK